MSIIAGYPWFTDWGRDTFIAMRGLCLATGRLDVAREILLAWAATVSEGMLPNRFPDRGDRPEYNSVDASLWFVVAVSDFHNAPTVIDADRRTLGDADAPNTARGCPVQAWPMGELLRLDRCILAAADDPPRC
ncbi:MAG: amylo-alpha-1,6-glucosidase [Lautropia sp.]